MQVGGDHPRRGRPGHPAGDPGGGGGGHQGGGGHLAHPGGGGRRRHPPDGGAPAETGPWDHRRLEAAGGPGGAGDHPELLRRHRRPGEAGGGGAPGPGARALVFDVRNNPGGYVTELTEILDDLLPEGKIFINRSSDGKETVYTSDADCVDLPMAVLVNRNSYSAAEFLAAQLQESAGAVVAGEQTSGKGFSQVLFDLPGGSAIGLSTARYYTGGGVSLIGTGLTPDPCAPCRRRMSRSCWPGSWSPRRTNSCRRPFRPWRSEGPVRPAGRGPFPGGKPGEPCDFPGKTRYAAEGQVHPLDRPGRKFL